MIVIANFEQLSGEKYVTIRGLAVTGFLTNQPSTRENVGVYNQADDKVYDITYVEIGSNPTISVEWDASWHNNFFKMRCVAGGMRVLKTSKQDSESGSLDLVYSRDGSSFDEGHAFRVDLARNRPDRARTYLADSGCCLRETNGFVIQTNKRPHDEASLDLLDIRKMHNSTGQNFAPHGHTASVWFIDLDDTVMYEAKDYASIPTGHRVGVVLESLQQRHTAMAIAQGLQSGMSLSFELVYHMEGIADQTAYGFTQSHAAKLRSAATSL